MKMNRFSNRALAIVTALLLLFQQIPALAAAEEWNSAASDPIGTEDYVTVRFTADGEEVAALLVRSGAAIGRLPDAPEREGYAFLGWFAGEEPVTEETVVTAATEVTASYINEAYPALRADYDNGRIAVRVSAPEGALPKGVSPVMETVSDELVRETVEGVMGHAVGQIAAVNISFLDENGSKIQPEKPVKVQIALTGMQADRVSVVHIPDELLPSPAKSGKKLMSAKRGAAPAAEVVDFSVQGDTLSFDADSFSVYAVVEGPLPEARMALNFWSGETKVATMYVKNSDTLEDLEIILYDPGVGELETGELFAGWILDKQNFTTADIANVMSIDDVREWAEAKTITEGETHDLYAAICKLYNVIYRDYSDTPNELGRAVGMDAIPVKSSEYGTAVVNYTVNMGYTPKDDVHNFEGWIADADTVTNITSAVPTDRIYQNETPITIKGDVSFTVNAPEGAWLIFDENGKGAKYNAPQFVKRDNVTEAPCPDADMTRLGYTFGGWYDTKEHADAHGANPSVTTGKFTFGQPLLSKTTLYASWIPNTTAPYTVILWVEKQDRTGYDLEDSYVGSGTVGQNIPYTFRDNQDEDYVRLAGVDYHYKGFCMQQPASQVAIRPEGDSVLNLYFKRIEYNVRFYLYRYRNQSGSNDYEYPRNSAAGNNVWGVVDFHERTTLANMPTTTYPGGIQSDSVDGYTSYYFVLSGYYGEDISSKWPRYSQIQGPKDDTARDTVSFVMMVGTRMKPNPSNGGDGTVKGIITTLDDGILGATNSSNGNFLIVRFNTYNDWTYHLYYEPYEGQDLTGKTLREFNGKTYYWDHDETSRSSNTIPGSQNAPEFPGFQTVRGSNNKALYDGTAPTSQIPQQNGVSGYKPYLNYYYDRLEYRITYKDGTYFNGAGSIIQNRQDEVLHSSELIAYQQEIPDEYKNYVPDLPESESGYVFAGWYADAACNNEYDFTTMPIDGIIVYAKWVQVQYRVFLHPNAGDSTTSPELDWGAENVSMSFRVDYDGKVSTPTGTREGSGYEFVAWYKDPSLGSQYLYNSDTKLNDTTVKTAYDQTEPTELDKWGNKTSDVNSDAQNNRFWIERKLDLYAKWRNVLDGAEGIRVIYTADDGKGHAGTNAPVDPSLYPDQTEVTAQAAATAPAGTRLMFKCWVVQKWDATQSKFVDTETNVLPGQHFNVLASLAHKEPVEGEGQTDRYTYTMQLRAEYTEPENETPTHIWWFDNYSSTSAARHESSHQDEGISINQAVDIQAARTREGYTFLGWARVPVATSESETGTPPTGKVLSLGSDDLYLKYDSDNNKFILNDPNSGYNGHYVTQVAADEADPYHDMYAVWEPLTKVPVEKIWQSGNFASHQPTSVTVELLRNGESFSPAKTIVLSAANEWKYTFEDLPTRDGKGKLIEYSIAETVPDGWKETYAPENVTATTDGTATQPLKVTNSPKNGKITLVKHISGPTEDYSSVFPDLTFTVKGPKQPDGTYKNTYTYTFSQFNNTGTSFSGQYTKTDNALSFVEPGEYIYYEDNADLLKPWGYSVDTTNPGTTGTTNPVTFTLAEGDDEQPFITNHYTRDFGNLRINKTVTGHDSGAFPYKVKIKNSKNWWLKQDLTLTSDETQAYVFEIPRTGNTLTGTLTLNNVPTGTYTVIEQGTEESGDAQIQNYELEVTYAPEGGAVTVAKGATAEATITNTYTLNAVPVTLKKVVNGNMANVNQEFSFTVKLTKSDGTTADEIEGITDNQGYVINPATSNTTFTLKHTDASATTLGEFPIGDKLVITETTGTGAELYKTAYTTTGTAPTFPIETDSKSVTMEVTELEAGKTAIEVICGNYWNIPIETGVTTDSAPYVLAVSAAMMSAAVWMLLRRRAKAAGRED